MSIKTCLNNSNEKMITMKASQDLNYFLRKRQSDLIKNYPLDVPIFDIESQYFSAGILIWHIMEDQIYMTEGFCRLMGMSKEGLLNLEMLFRLEMASELRTYLRNILDQVCNNEIADTTFKTRIPGIDKEIFGSVQLFDQEDIGILDLMVICWGES